MLLRRGGTVCIADGILEDGFAVGEETIPGMRHMPRRDRYVASPAASSAVNERLEAAHPWDAEMSV